jgi:hypothetical protein
MNANAVAVERGYGRPIMSGLHGVWSVGLLAGSAVGTGAAALGAGVVLHFTVVAAVLAVATVAATGGLLAATPEEVPGLPRPRVWSAPVLLLGLIAFSSFAGEGSAADWSAVYMRETVGTGTGAAGIAFVAFSLGMIASRFAGDALSASVGRTRVARGGGLVAAAGLALALGTVGVVVVPAAASYRAEAAALPVGRASGCMVRDRPYVPADVERCYWRAARPKGWVMLAGDSHADAISTGVVAAATRLGYDVLTLTGAQCEFARRPAPSEFLPNCAAMNNDLLDLATGANPPAVVAMSHWGAARLKTEKNWPRALDPTLTELRRARVPVLFVLDVPNFACTLPREQVEDIQGDARDAELRLAVGRPGVTVYDPWPHFCNATVCSSVVHGRLAYRDFAHLNAIGGTLLAPDLQRVMRTAMRAARR